MNGALFRHGDFTLRSGAKSRWKIEADSLTPEDWATLAMMAAEILPPFGAVEGVPRGGIPFALALSPWRRCVCGLFEAGGHRTPFCDGFRPGPYPLLIAEDVVTTGGSMERQRNGREAIGVAVFARGIYPAWVTPLFLLAIQAQRRPDCGVMVQGRDHAEPCALSAGHAGKHMWGSGD